MTSLLTILATFLILLLMTCICYLISSSASSKSKNAKLPPGPRPLPVIGNLPHRSLQHLARKYGDKMSLRLGNVPTILVSSSKAAALFLKAHDTNFASRPIIQAAEYLAYGSKGMAFSQYGPYWRHVRKLCTFQLFCPSKLEEVGVLVRKLRRAAEGGQVVNISEEIGLMKKEITYRMVLGCKGDDSFDLKAIVDEALYLVGGFNISDFVPSLKTFDIQGLTKRMKSEASEQDDRSTSREIIDEHEEAAKTKDEKPGHNDDDFVDVLLSLINQPFNPNDEHVHFIDRTNVKAILIEMIAGSFDTSATSIVWSLAEILRHPRVLKNLQQELESVVGMDRMVEETDLPKLNYSSMVIRESLRVHPVAPLLNPHEAIENITAEKYGIPKKSRIIVNVWTIGRDPDVWSENAEEFYPERFVNSNVDLWGHDFELIPFGSGRRRCPAMTLGLSTVRLVLAQLVHCFNWELPTGLLPQDLNTTEKFSISMSKATHLHAKPTYRIM